MLGKLGCVRVCMKVSFIYNICFVLLKEVVVFVYVVDVLIILYYKYNEKEVNG